MIATAVLRRHPAACQAAVVLGKEVVRPPRQQFLRIRGQRVACAR